MNTGNGFSAIEAAVVLALLAETFLQREKQPTHFKVDSNVDTFDEELDSS